jgi:ABC-type microcin C transport system duplicated ATPase subunit YejF
MVFQDPYCSLNPRLRVLPAEALAVHASCRRPHRARIERLPIRSICRCRRTATARVLRAAAPAHRHARGASVEPQVIIADEPVSALDASVQAQIVNLLLELQNGARAHARLHHATCASRHIAHRTAVMYLGRIVEIGPTVAMFGARGTPRRVRAPCRALCPAAAATAAVRGELPAPPRRRRLPSTRAARMPSRSPPPAPALSPAAAVALGLPLRRCLCRPAEEASGPG